MTCIYFLENTYFKNIISFLYCIINIEYIHLYILSEICGYNGII